MDKIDLGNTLRGVRKGAGKTQADIARALATSQTTVSDWETGTNEPPLAMVYAWAAACGLGARLLFGNANTTPDTDRLVAAWQRLSADERETYLEIIETRARKKQ